MTISLLADQIARQDAIEWIGLVTGVVYVALATIQRPSCWIFGIISSACIAWKSFTDYFLIADGILQIFYIAIGVIGLWVWMRGRKPGLEKPVIQSAASNHLVITGVLSALAWPVSWVLVHYAQARYGYVDTGLTLLSIWATILLIRKDLATWLYWIGIDLVYVVLYWKSDGLLFALLFLVYALVSIWGWINWRRQIAAYS